MKLIKDVYIIIIIIVYQSIQNLKEKPKVFSKLNTSNLFGIKGLYQMGNTCYMSCIIQCLTHTLPIKTYFLLENHVNTVYILLFIYFLALWK